MQKLHFLNSREKKDLFKQLEEQFACTEALECIFCENPEGKIFLLSNEYAKLETQGLRINNRGLYFGKREREGIRLSLEGAQVIHPKKNIVELNKHQAQQWMMGEDIPMEGNLGFVVLKLEKDILGCGMLKNNILRNMVPKERRLHSITESDRFSIEEESS